MLIQGKTLKKEIAGRILFQGISFEIEQDEKIAIIGNNGVGKTTLIKILAGCESYDAGEIYVQCPKEAIGYLEQNIIVDEHVTVKDFLYEINPNYVIAHNKLGEIEALLASVGEQQLGILEEYNQVYEQFLAAGGYTWEQQVKNQFSKMAISKKLFDMKFKDLSGGQKTQIQIIKILLKAPQLLILDEPTNHLDYETIEWLIKFLKAYSGTVLFVSHDRYFIDSIANKVYELTEQKLIKYKGNYADYEEQKELQQKTQKALYEKQTREKKKLETIVSQYKQWFHRADRSASVRDYYAKKKANKHVTRLRAKEKALERLEQERVSKPLEDEVIKLQFHEREFRTSTLLELRKIKFSYTKELLIQALSLTIGKGEKIALLGKNGSGKSTLLKLIQGDISLQDGEIYRHPNLNIGYYSQELKNIDGEQTILDFILELPNMTKTDARTILGCFFFKRDDVFKSLSKLSMGEKSRVAFVRLYFSDFNLLMLDEPTNYLDITSCKIIENALINYPGAVIFISHDIYFVKNIANRLVILDKQGTRSFKGSFDEFIEAENIRKGNGNEVMRQKLELQLSVYMSQTTFDKPEDKEQLMEQIIALKNQIQELK